MAKRLAVLLSGAGSNFQALLAAKQNGLLAADLVGVFSDQPAASGLAIARSADVPARAFARADYPSKQALEAAIFDAVLACAPTLIVLAGFMRVISAATIARVPCPMLNLHPSLLPKYPGLHTHQRVLDAGDIEHGASVHVVTKELDAGPILAQVRIKVEPGDDAIALAARLKPWEHKLLLATVQLALNERVAIQPSHISVDGKVLTKALELSHDTLQLC